MKTLLKLGLFLTGCGILLYILLDIVVDISNFIIITFL